MVPTAGQSIRGNYFLWTVCMKTDDRNARCWSYLVHIWFSVSIVWISLRIWSTNEIVKSCFHISSDFEQKCWISKWIIWMEWGGIFSTVITVVKVACLHIFIFWQMFAKKKINKCPDNTDIFPCSRYSQIHICLDIVKWGRGACKGPCWVIVFCKAPSTAEFASGLVPQVPHLCYTGWL